MESGMYLILVLSLTAVDRNIVNGCLRQSVTDEIRVELKQQGKSHIDSLEKHVESKIFQAEMDKFRKAFEMNQGREEKDVVSTSKQINEIKNTIDRLKKEVYYDIRTEKNLLKEVQEKNNKQENYLKKAKEDINLFNKTMQMKLNALTKSIQELETASEKHLKEIQQSLKMLSTVVNSDLETKNSEIKSNIEAVKEAKVVSDKMLSGLQEVMDKILPNTFNKGAAETAFFVVVLFVFILAFWTHVFQQKISRKSQQKKQKKISKRQ